MKPFWSVLLFFICIEQSILAQIPVNEKHVEQQIESIAERSEADESADYSQLTEQLSELTRKPIDLNKAGREELLSTGLLNEVQIHNLLRHRMENGELLTLLELQTIDAFDIHTISRILPYVSIHQEDQPLRLMERRNMRSALILRYQKKISDPDAFRIVGNYRLTLSPFLKVNVTVENDAGETFSIRNKRLFDYVSAAIMMRPSSKTKILVGDYTVSLGQGLTIWKGFAAAKSFDPLAVKRVPQGIREYTSTMEDGFFRGGAIEKTISSFRITAFVSALKRDGRYSSDSGAIRTFIETGYHRTQGEMATRKNISEQAAGADISFIHRSLTAGITNFIVSYPLPIIKDPSKIYNLYHRAPSVSTFTGGHYSFTRGNSNFFGEVVSSHNSTISFNSGVYSYLDRRLTTVIAVRRYDKSYYNLHANAFSENLLPSNEYGVYAGIISPVSKVFQISSFIDRFSFPFLKHMVNSPSRGQELMTQLTCTFSKATELYVRAGYREKGAATGGEEHSGGSSSIRKFIRLNFSAQVDRHLSIKTRIERTAVTTEDGYETGTLLFQDISYRFERLNLSVTARSAIFGTDGFNSRIYAYENDVLYSFSIPAYQGHGSRNYILVKYTPFKSVDLWLRYSRTSVGNTTAKSTGDLKAQVRITF